MKRHIPALIWSAAGILLCIYFVGFGQGLRLHDGAQLYLLYGALALAVGGYLTHVLLWRKENLSSVNFGYKLALGLLALLLLLSSFIKDLFF